MHEAGRHKMGKHWHHGMGPKRWGTLSETTLEQGAAAWRWLQHYASGKCPSDVKLEDAYFSKFAVTHEIFTKIAFTKADRRMKWMLKTNNIFYVWAIRLGLA